MPSDSAPPPSALTHALDQSGGSQNNTVAAAAAADDALSPLEQEVLDEYARLLGNLNNVGLSFSLSHTLCLFFCCTLKTDAFFFRVGFSCRHCSVIWRRTRHRRFSIRCVGWSARRVWCLRCSRRVCTAYCCRSRLGMIWMRRRGDFWGSDGERDELL